MTIKELSRIVGQNSLAIAENSKAIAQLTNGILTSHDSIKSLERIALAHDEALETLTKDIANLTREWQAYVKRLPKS